MLVILKDIWSKELQRDRPLQLRVLGLVNDTHPALAELFGDAVVADGRADHDAPILSQTGLLVITSRRVGNWRGSPSGPGLAVSGVSPFVPV